MNVVQTLNLGLKKHAANLYTTRSNVSSTGSSVDYSIRARRSIGTRLSSLNSRLYALETRLRELDKFADLGVTSYTTDETELKSKADGVNGLVGGKVAKVLLSAFEEMIGLMSKADSAKLLIAGMGLSFKLAKDANGNTVIKLFKGAINNNADYLKYKNLMTQYLGGTAKWDKPFMEKLAKEGIALYGNRGGRVPGYFDSNMNKLINTKFKGLEEVLDKLHQTKWTKFKTTFGKEMDMLADLKDWKGASKLTMFGKSLGIIGNLYTIFDNFTENKTTQEKWVDTSIDLLSGTTAMATGAAIGSLIFPPLGTVVGAGVGVALNVGLNYPFFGDDPKKSVVDVTKKFTNDLVTDIGEGINNLGNKISKLFW